jgi:hypothetical protein
MSLEIADKAATRRRRFWLTLAAALVGVLVAAAVLSAMMGDEDSATGPTDAGAGVPAQRQDATTTRPGTAPESTAVWVPPAHKVVLPEGSARLSEFPIGFPQTPEGAAAAEVAKDRYSTTLDYELASTLARVYMPPDLDPAAYQPFVDAVAALRSRLGVPATGPVPTDVGAVTRPVGVQWSAVAPDRTEVSVLVQVEYRTAERSWSQLAASTTVWQWMPGERGRPPDWRLVDARQPTAELAQLGTAQFNEEGWVAVVTEVPR